MADRRRRLKVKNRFQDRMILEIVLIAFVFINTLVVLSFIALETFSDLPSLKYLLGGALAIGETGGLIILYFYSVKASHRIAGPIVNFEQSLRRVATGDLTQRIRLRNSDNFNDTAEIFNECFAELGEKIGLLKATAEELSQHLQRHQDPTPCMDKLLAQLNEFKTDIPIESLDDPDNTPPSTT